MPIRNYDLETARIAGASPGPAKQRGRRVVRHMGGRLIAAASPTCMVAIPTLPGESLERMSIQTYSAADSNVQPDSAEAMDWVAVWYPWDFISSITGASITSAGLDSMISKVLSPLSPFGGEPNPGGEDPTSPASIFGPFEAFWSRTALLAATLWAGVGDIVGSDARPTAKFQETFNKNLYWTTPGLVLVGCELLPTDAQTDFGAAEIDTGLTDAQYEHIATVENDNDFSLLNAQEKQAYELLYGGDTYIEADTWKDDDVRAHIMVQAQIRTPYPERGYQFE